MYAKEIIEVLKKAGASEGDFIRVMLRDGCVREGILMPRSEFGNEKCLVIKLKNGYNIGISAKKIKSVEVIEKRKKKDTILQRKPSKTKGGKKPKVVILHTGGTIASRVDYETGGVKALFSPEELLDLFPEMEKYALIDSKLIANALSENLRFGHYNKMIDAIEKEIKKGVDGIILTHGTDTMAYTAAAIAFAFENLPVPVILVGAQRSSDRPSSDAAMNLISALQFITTTDFCDVGICMHATTSDDYCHILPACKTRKMHTSARYAFQAINAKPYAKVWWKEERVEFLQDDYVRKSDVKGKLVVRKFREDIKVGLLKAHPHLMPEEVLAYQGFDGMVIEGTGLGHIGIESFDELSKENEEVMKALKKVIESGTIVVMTSQCLYGRVNMNVYSTGRKLLKMGVLGNLTDMLPEVAFVKLAWLLSNFKKDEIPKLWHTNLRGEISDRTLE